LGSEALWLSIGLTASKTILPLTQQTSSNQKRHLLHLTKHPLPKTSSPGQKPPTKTFVASRLKPRPVKPKLRQNLPQPEAIEPATVEEPIAAIEPASAQTVEEAAPVIAEVSTEVSTVEAPVSAEIEPAPDPQIPFWMQAEADRQARLDRLKAEAIEAAEPEVAQPNLCQWQRSP
jgi:hypothetical protein